MDKRHSDEVRNLVRQNYGKIAASGQAGCSCSSSCCGSPQEQEGATMLSRRVGYSDAELTAVPEGANLGLGCGNPQAIASLQPGETVLDLGSGGGFDSFLAVRAVGESGLVIGVDMTPEMVSRARGNAVKAGFANVEFRLGELENLPVADGIVDVILSNCVINLSPEKKRVFREAFRVLKPGGRLAISDVVRTADLPDAVKNDPMMLAGCVAGASSIQEIEAMLRAAGFAKIRITPKAESADFIKDWAPGTGVERYILSAIIEAVKPLDSLS